MYMSDGNSCNLELQIHRNLRQYMTIKGQMMQTNYLLEYIIKSSTCYFQT